MFAETLARLEHRIRPALAALSPSTQTMIFSKGRRMFLKLLEREEVPEFEPEKGLHRVLWGMEHQGPLMWAAGIDKDGKLYHVSANQGAAGHMVGTTTANAREGNVKEGVRNPCVSLPRSHAALNFLGLPNEGHEVVSARFRGFVQKPACPLWASVMASPDQVGDEQLKGVVEGLALYAASGARVLELNESCPNTTHDHSQLEGRLAYVGREFIARCSTPVDVKFTVDTKVQDVPAILDALFKHGFRGVNFGNSSKEYKGYLGSVVAREQEVFAYFTKRFGGGFTGRALKDKSLDLCAAAVDYVKKGGPGYEFNVVRTGGVDCANDLRESDQAGVAMNQWVTGYWERFGKEGHKVYQRLLREYGGRR